MTGAYFKTLLKWIDLEKSKSLNNQSTPHSTTATAESLSNLKISTDKHANPDNLKPLYLRATTRNIYYLVATNIITKIKPITFRQLLKIFNARKYDSQQRDAVLFHDDNCVI